MLIKKTEDQPIKGVRIRERAFYTFAGCFAFSLVLCAVLLFPIPTLIHGDLFLCAVMYLLGLIPLSVFGWAMYAFRTVRCILTPDRLCFFGARVEETKENSRCAIITENCDGSVHYADVRKAEREVMRRYPRGKRSDVLLSGNGFRVRIPDAGLLLIWRLRSARRRAQGLPAPASAPQPAPDTSAHKLRKGVWGELWTACTSGEWEREFADEWEILRLDLTPETDSIDISIRVRGQDVDFALDKSSLLMMAGGKNEQTLSLRNIQHLPDLYTHMRRFVSTNTVSTLG